MLKVQLLQSTATGQSLSHLHATPLSAGDRKASLRQSATLLQGGLLKWIPTGLDDLRPTDEQLRQKAALTEPSVLSSPQVEKTRPSGRPHIPQEDACKVRTYQDRREPVGRGEAAYWPHEVPSPQP